MRGNESALHSYAENFARAGPWKSEMLDEQEVVNATANESRRRSEASKWLCETGANALCLEVEYLYCA